MMGETLGHRVSGGTRHSAALELQLHIRTRH